MQGISLDESGILGQWVSNESEQNVTLDLEFQPNENASMEVLPKEIIIQPEKKSYGRG